MGIVRIYDKLKKHIKRGTALILVTINISFPSATIKDASHETEDYYFYSENNINYMISKQEAEESRAFQAQYEMENSKYILKYQEIISNTANLFNRLRINTPSSILGAFCFLLYNGYFSTEQYYEYSNNIDFSNYLIKYRSLQIMDGRGNCVSEAMMLKDILNAMGYEAYAILNKFNGNNFPINKEAVSLPKIYNHEKSETMKDANIFPYTANNLYDIFNANHCFTLVRNGKELYVLDPDKALIIDISKNKTVLTTNTIYSKGEFQTKLISSLFFETITLEELKRIEKMLTEQEQLNKESFWSDFTNGVLSCFDNKFLLEQFYKENLSSIVYVSTKSDYVDDKFNNKEENKEILEQALLEIIEKYNFRQKEISNSIVDSMNISLPLALFLMITILKRRKEIESKKEERSI